MTLVLVFVRKRLLVGEICPPLGDMIEFRDWTVNPAGEVMVRDNWDLDSFNVYWFTAASRLPLTTKLVWCSFPTL